MKNKNNAAIFRSKSRAIALEPRLLFDGAGAVGVADAMEDSYTQPEQNQHEAGHNDTDTNGIFNGDELHIPGGASPSTLVIIDSRVDEFQSLLADLPANTVVRVVDSEESGLAAISDELAKGGNFDAVHIFSHGTPGSFTLGSDQVDSSTLANQAEQLQSWSLSLTEEADILLYGCDIAQGETGQAFITQLATLTGADIAASTNATGAAAQDGDWVLESETGSIEAQGFEFGVYGGLMADPAPDAKIAVEDDQPLIGEDFTVKLTFDNTGSAVGYGPFADLFIGHKGADGSTTDFTKSDGLNFKSATFFGSDVEHKIYTLTNNAPVGDQLQIISGKITHPITGQQIDVPAKFGAGDQLLVVTLPFGSFTPEQLTTIDVTLTVDKKADPNQALHLASSGGFMFGKDPLDNPGTDPALHQNATNTLTIKPQAFTVETFLRAPEGETATGPNFVRHVDVVITPAAGTNLSDATRFSFTLPDGLVLVDGWTPPAGWEVETSPVYDSSTTNDTLVLKRVAGQVITAETTIRVGVYVTEKYQDGNDVIAAGTGDATAIAFAVNAVKVTDGQWRGVSGSSLNGTTRDQLAVNVEKTVATLTARSVQVINDVIYKNGSTTAMGENDTVKPGDALEYRLQVDISDFFRTGDVVVTDTLPDGITFDKDFVPTLNVQWRDVNGTDRTSTVNFDPANVEVLSADGTTWVALSTFGSDLVTQAADGKTLFRFNLSKQLAAGGNEHLLGGLVGTDGNTVGEQNKWLGAGGTLGTGATTALISFKAKVDENYRTSDPLASGITNQNLKERDVLNNTATVTVGILDRANGTVNKADQFDDSSEAISLPAGKVNLEIATITRDGVQLTGDLSQVTLAAGDKVTYKLTYDLPIGDYEKLSFDAYLPMPVFNLTAGVMTQDTAHGNTPDAGKWNFGSGTTTTGHAADVTVGANNKITLKLNDSGGVDSSSPKKIELVFTATVTDKPMADRLKLTAQGTHTDSSSQAIAGSTAAINQIVIGQPDVHVYKGYVNPADTQTGTTAVAGLPVNNKITSATVAGIGASDASKFDGGDKLTVIIAVENQGTSAKGAFNVEIKDALDPNLTADASTLKFYKGDGTELTQVEINTGSGWTITTVAGNQAAILAALQTGNGVRFVDGADGALGRGKLDAGTVVNDGSNIIYISYAATVKAEVLAKATSTTNAQLTGFANSETGDNFLAAAREEAAKIDFRGNKVDVKIIATEGHDDTHVAGTGKTADAVVGEFVDYQVTISLAEAKTENGQIVVTLPAGLGLVNVAGVTEAGNVSISHAGFGAGSTINGNSVSTDGTTTASITEIAANKFTVSLGDIINNDNDEGDETITLNFRAVVLNTAENITAKTLAVKAEFTGRDTNEATRTATTTVREPQLTATITADKTTVTADDEVTYTLTVKNNSIYAAHDVVIDEVFNQIAQDHLRELTIVSTSANSGVTGGVVGATEAIKYEIVKLDKGESFTVTFKVKVEPGTPFGQDLTIDPTITWTSIPGDAADRGAIANTTTDSERTGAATESTANAEIGTGVNKYSTRPSATIKFATPTPQITIDSTSYAGTAGPNDPDVTTDDATETTVVIGETVRIRMVVELPESTSTGVKLTPTLPAGLTYLGNATVGFLSDAEITSTKVSGAHIVGSDPQAANPSALITIVDGAFDLGDLNNPDRDGDSEYIIIEFDAVVANIASNTKDTELKVNYKLSSAGASDATSGDVTLTIVEPAISIDKQITEVVYANADLATSTAATVTYSITIKNTGNSVAHDVELNDVLPAGATILTAPSTSSANGTITDNSTGGAPNYVIGALGVGEEITITYSVTVDDRTQSPTGTDTNATVTWTSLPSSLDSAAGVVERTGAGDGANTYTAKDPAAFATVTGTLWDDTNNKNGVIDGDELKLAGVEVTLTATSGPMNGKTLTTITDGNGLYNFGALPVGDYTISAAGEVIKEIQGDTDTLIPTWDTDGDGNGLGTITVTGLTEGQVVADKNVGYLQENDAPTVTFTDTTTERVFTEGIDTVDPDDREVLGTPINLGNVEIVDPELSRTTQLGTFAGTTLIVGRSDATDGFSANAEDVLGFNDSVSISSNEISVGGIVVATFTNANGELSITFNAEATDTSVNTVASAITYANSSDTPPVEVTLRYRFNDANKNNEQGRGPALAGDATIKITINAQNDPPKAVDDSNALLNSDEAPVTGNVILGEHKNVSGGVANSVGADSDPDTDIENLKVSNIQGHGGSEAVGADPITITGKYGTLTIKGDGSYSYVLDQNNADVYGLAESTTLNEEFTYTLSDGDKTDTAKLVITITGDTPPALGITFTDHNGTDVPGTPETTGHATVHESGLTGGSEQGSNKHIHTDGKITVTSPSGLQKLEIGGTTFTAADLQTASPSNPLTVTTPLGTLTITGATFTGDPTAPKSVELTYNYKLNERADNSAAADDAGLTDPITLLVTDSLNATATGDLKIFIVDDAPTANPDVNELLVSTGSVTGNVYTNDTIGADVPAATGPVTAGTFVGTFGGTLTLAADGSYTYVVDPNNPAVQALTGNATLTETYTYTITDADGDTTTSTLTITIKDNTPPVAINDSATTDEDTPVSGNILTNDSDPDGDPLTVTQITVGGNTVDVPTNGSKVSITVPGKGTLIIDKTGGYTFTPNPGVIGQIPDITYKITDGNGGNDSAKLTINVRPGNPPVAPPPANPVDGGFNSPLVSPADPIRSRGLMDSAVITDPSVFYEGERWDDVRRLPIPLQPVVYVNNEVAVAQQQREADDLRANSATEQTQPFVSQSISLAMGLGQDHNLFVSHAVRDAQQTAASLDSRVSGRLSRTDLSADSMLFTPDLRSPQFMQDVDEATKAKQKQAPVVEEKEEGEDEVALQMFETDEADFMTEQGVMPVAASFTEQLRGNSRHLPFAAREKNFLI